MGMKIFPFGGGGKHKHHHHKHKEPRKYSWREVLTYARDRCIGSAKWTTFALALVGLFQAVICGVIVSLVASSGFLPVEVNCVTRYADNPEDVDSIKNCPQGGLEHIMTERIEERLECMNANNGCSDYPDGLSTNVNTCTLCQFMHNSKCVDTTCNLGQQLSIIELRSACDPECTETLDKFGYSVPLGQPNMPQSFVDHLWSGWVLMTDPTTMAGAAGTAQQLVSAIVTFSGFLLFAVMVGFVVDAIQRLYENLKSGVGPVAEKGHIVIVGWTDRTLEVVRELTLAAASEGGTRIVILAEQEKAHIMLELQAGIAEMHGSKLTIRTGLGTNMKDLQMVGVTNAKVVIILGDPACPDKADSFVLRTVLCMKGLKFTFDGHVVAEMRDHENEQLVRLIGGACMETVIYTDITDDVLLMCMREPGLALVYESILGFDGDEFYLERWEELDGLEWSEIQGYFPDAIPVGYQNAKGKIKLNPEKEEELPHGSRLLVIAEDDDSYKPMPPLPMLSKGQIPKFKEQTEVEDILICGWRDDLAEIINQLDKMVQKGSTLHILCEMSEEARVEDLLDQGLDVREHQQYPQLKHLQLEHHVGNISQRRYLEKLPLSTLKSCLVLGDEESAQKDGGMESDSTTLACVLLLRDMQSQMLARKDLLEVKKTKHDATALLMEQGLDQLRDPDSEDAGPAVKEHEEEEEHHESESSDEESEDEEEDEKLALELRFWQQGMETLPIVCQVESSTTRAIIGGNHKVETAADYVYSNEVLSKVLAMVAERREMKSVLMELLGPFGAGLHIKDIRRYCHPGENHSFYTLAKRVMEKDETLIGYREKGRPVKINPDHKDFARQWEEVELIVMSGRAQETWEHVLESRLGTKKAIVNKKHWIHLRLVEEERKDAREKEREAKKTKKGTTEMLVEQGLMDLEEVAEREYGCGEAGAWRQHLLMQAMDPGLTEGHIEHGERIIMEEGKLKHKHGHQEGKRTLQELLAMEEGDDDKFEGYGENVDEALNKLLLQIVEVDRKTTNNHRKMGAHVDELAQRLDTMNSKTENLSLNVQTVRDDIRHMRESIKLIAENTKKTQQIVKLY